MNSCYWEAVMKTEVLRACEIHGLVFCEYISNSPEQVTFPLGFSRQLPTSLLFLQIQLSGRIFS